MVGKMPYGPRTLDAEFDFVEHQLVLRTDEGAVRQIALRPRRRAPERTRSHGRRTRSPPVLRDAVPLPGAAYYHPQMSEFILPYAAVRTAASPVETLLAFLHSTYDAAADLAHWDREAIERPA